MARARGFTPHNERQIPNLVTHVPGPVFNVRDPQFGAKGDGTTDDTSVISAAVTSAATEGGVVYVPPGTYVLSASIALAAGVTLQLAKGATLKPTTAGPDVHVVTMAPGAHLLGPGTIDASGLGADFAGCAAVYLQGSSVYNLRHNTYVGGGLYIKNSTARRGRGIWIDVDATASNNVTFCRFHDIVIENMAYGVLIEVAQPVSGVTYANGNIFSNMTLITNMYDVWIDGGNDQRANGNIFSNITTEPSSATVYSLRVVNAKTNQFANFMVWDPSLASANTVVRFDESTSENYFHGWLWRKHVRDYGSANVIHTTRAHAPLKRVIVPPGNIKAPSYTPLDDFLLFASQRFTITETGTTPTTGTIANAFVTARNAYAIYGSAINTTAAVIEIDLGGTYNYLQAVGVNFDQGEQASEVKIEAYNGTAWSTLYDTTVNGNEQVMVNTESGGSAPAYSYTVTKLRFTLKTAYNTSTNQVRLERFWCYMGDRVGPGWLRADAGTLYGTLNQNNKIITNPHGGATGSRPGSPTTGQQYFDSTLGIPVWYDGTNWVDASGTTV